MVHILGVFVMIQGIFEAWYGAGVGEERMGMARKTGKIE
jgi:hypothetical protein